MSVAPWTLQATSTNAGLLSCAAFYARFAVRLLCARDVRFDGWNLEIGISAWALMLNVDAVIAE